MGLIRFLGDIGTSIKQERRATIARENDVNDVLVLLVENNPQAYLKHAKVKRSWLGKVMIDFGLVDKSWRLIEVQETFIPSDKYFLIARQTPQSAALGESWNLWRDQGHPTNMMSVRKERLAEVLQVAVNEVKADQGRLGVPGLFVAQA